jgi:predicted aminopeptidase
LLVLGTLLLLFNCKNVKYALQQANGQLKVLRKAVPVSKILADPNTPDSTRQKLLLIEEIRQFAIDSLGLKNTKNYQKVYDQHGKPLLKLVIASDKYELKPLKWKFPFIGTFEYKGFFNFDDAYKLETELKTKNYDTYISDVAAWSTLGTFKDPILSEMLYQDSGNLADLIIHEMVHSTIFIKNNHALSENLANFIGKHGALAFLQHKYGASSPQLNEYLDDLRFSDAHEQLMGQASKILNSYYQSEAFRMSAKKDSLKNIQLMLLKSQRDSLLQQYNRQIRRNFVPNNAYYVGYLTYHAKQNEFEDELKNIFKNDFRKYLNSLKSRFNK